MPSQKVSIITSTYNRSDLLLNRCLPSLRAQTYKNIEFVIVSDGPDKNLEILKNEANVKYVELGRNWGAFGGHAKLVGSYMASGDLIGYLDDDDEFTPDHVESLVHKQTETQADFVFSRMFGPTKEGNMVLVGDGTPGHMRIGTPMILHKRELFQVNNWKPSLSYNDDWMLVEGWIKAGCTFAYLDMVTVLLRGATIHQLHELHPKANRPAFGQSQPILPGQTWKYVYKFSGFGK